MKLLILYQPRSEYAKMVEDYVDELVERYPEQLPELVDWDSPDGVARAELYGVFDQPAILVINNDGILQASWTGSQLPLMQEIEGYLHA